MGVLLVRVYAFDCDTDGCDSVSDDYIPPGDVARPLAWAKAQARNAGWTFTGATVLCPEHSPRRARNRRR